MHHDTQKHLTKIKLYKIYIFACPLWSYKSWVRLLVAIGGAANLVHSLKRCSVVMWISTENIGELRVETAFCQREQYKTGVLMCWSPYCYWHNCISLLICVLLHNNDIIRAVAWYIGHTKRTLGECMCKHFRYVKQHNSSQEDHQGLGEYQTTCLTIWRKRSRFAQIFKDPTRTWATMDL